MPRHIRSITGRRFSSITVRELRELLEGEDDEAMVAVVADYGDHHHTTQALPLKGEADWEKIEETAYSNSGWAVVSAESDDEEDDEERPTVLVIR